MTGWTSDELTRIATAQELQIASARPDGTLRTPRTIWVVRVGDDLYVRSMYGRAGGWFPATQVRHRGHIRAAASTRTSPSPTLTPTSTTRSTPPTETSTAATAQTSSAASSTLRLEPPRSNSCRAEPARSSPAFDGRRSTGLAALRELVASDHREPLWMRVGPARPTAADPRPPHPTARVLAAARIAPRPPAAAL